MIQEKLASYIRALTERAIAPESIYIDDAHVATTIIDGVVFRMRGDDLMMLRPCTHCGIGQFESPVIKSVTDLGHALTTWHPLCQHCASEEDMDDWMNDVVG